MLSPFLFIFYLEELLAMIEEQNCKGIFIDEDNPNIPMLMYADDIVIVGDKIGEVQKTLDCLDLYCKKWKLDVNMEKTKLMVFRNEGKTKRNEAV